MKNFVVFLLLSALFGSCSNSNNEMRSEDIKAESMQKARMIFTTPDSLLSADEKELVKKLEQAIYGGEFFILKDVGYAIQFETIAGKEEWKKKGLPEIYYDIFLNDMLCNNKGLLELDTITFPKQLILDAFHAKQAEYLPEKNLNNLENEK